MSVDTVEIDCPGCDGDGYTVPYGPNGYEPEEACETCNGTKKITIDKVCCFCKKDLRSADSNQYEIHDGHLWCMTCADRESDTGDTP